MKKIVSLLLLVFFTFSSCEKDDICDANISTTPRLVIQFYDITNQTELKNVTNLKVIGDGKTEGIVFNQSATGEAKHLANGSTISIPLKTDVNTTKYSFILNSGSDSSNEDEIKFEYTRENSYVSRACGFKTIFTFDPTNPYSHTDSAIPDLLWIKDIRIEKNNIVNENETHVKIYF
jgi:hypothetical protein